ncbi:hypothetical protein TI39_contig350g00023 [Zymoseptoria brevis]|uniref:Uncharacterized protein n=1 Tax=Zymoseptoria brevis TaxID=1047168 RepID=A0A0F4GQZ4_9PEZI|nr:hypothetical protein TI39_contig350g00023 [Zymoseptoria brevis]
MVPSDGSHVTHSTADKSITIEEIIFSCDVCQAVVSDIYATKDSNHGFSSGDGDENGTVARLWMGACTHIFCSKHLEGGAVPFHSKNSGPRAPCPVCAASGDFNLRELFAIRGVTPGEYDGVIPSDWLVCPPIKLDAEGPGMDALRFQYNRFVRYSTKVREIFTSAESKQRTMEAALAKERKQRRKREASLQKELEECKVALEDATSRLEKWNQRKDGIEHYMAMRSQLRELGVDYPLKQYAFDEPSGSVRNAQQSRADHGGSYDCNVTTGRQKSSSSNKRKMSDYDPYADARADSVNTTYQSGLGRVPPSQCGGTQFEHGTHLNSQRLSLASQSTRRPQDPYPRPPLQSVALPSQTPIVPPWEDLQQRRAPPTTAQDPRQLDSYGVPPDGSHRQYLSGYGATSPQHSQRDLISRIGHTRLDSEARKSIPSDGSRMPLNDSRQVLREDVRYSGSRESHPREHDIYQENDPAARILETNLTSGTRRPRINHSDASYGRIAQQSSMHAPREMEPVPPSTGSLLRTDATQEPGFKYQQRSPARRRIADPPATSDSTVTGAALLRQGEEAISAQIRPRPYVARWALLRSAH